MEVGGARGGLNGRPVRLMWRRAFNLAVSTACILSQVMIEAIYCNDIIREERRCLVVCHSLSHGKVLARTSACGMAVDCSESV